MALASEISQFFWIDSRTAANFLRTAGAANRSVCATLSDLPNPLQSRAFLPALALHGAIRTDEAPQECGTSRVSFEHSNRWRVPIHPMPALSRTSRMKTAELDVADKERATTSASGLDQPDDAHFAVVPFGPQG